MAIEKKVNIQAGNNYFGNKKRKYKEAKSKVAMVKDMAEYNKDDWLKEDIKEREDRFINTIYDFFKQNLVHK